MAQLPSLDPKIKDDQLLQPWLNMDAKLGRLTGIGVLLG